MTAAGWYRDSAARSLILRGYLPWLAALSLAWEILQLPLYTIWSEAAAGYIAFALAHCTAGDVLTGLGSLALALLATRAGGMETWNWQAVAFLLAVFGVAYTGFSEWTNTVLRPAWAYSQLMPTLRVAGVELGLSPLLQWLAVPPLALYLARSTRAA
ncbi:MAG TPA: hypothetical protein VEL04_07840 [Burkholderiales bacterium]|nr:hypothetical protein [Burkholderiales bacterium]